MSIPSSAPISQQIKILMTIEVDVVGVKPFAATSWWRFHFGEITPTKTLQRLRSIALENFDAQHSRLRDPILIVLHVGNNLEGEKRKLRRDLESKSRTFRQVLNDTISIQRCVETPDSLPYWRRRLLPLHLR